MLEQHKRVYECLYGMPELTFPFVLFVVHPFFRQSSVTPCLGANESLSQHVVRVFFQSSLVSSHRTQIHTHIELCVCVEESNYNIACALSYALDNRLSDYILTTTTVRRQF